MTILHFPGENDFVERRKKDRRKINTDLVAIDMLWELLEICNIKDNNEQADKFGLYFVKVNNYLSEMD